MTGRILIIDSVATNRIVLKVKLLDAQYRVSACASLTEAGNSIAQDKPDLILMDLTTAGADSTGFCRALRADPATADIPIVGMGYFATPQDRVPAFQAGIDDALGKPIPDSLMLARIRSLMRSSDVAREMRLREDTSRALGFAEPAADFARPARIVLASGQVAASLAFRTQLADATGARLCALAPALVLTETPGADPTDLFVIDARVATGKDANAQVFELIANLRSRTETRHAAQMVLIPDGGAELGAMALDLGANDVVSAGASLQEIALRCRALIARKSLLDRMRATVETGMLAAVTDPLTGLFNRRYALPHLSAMADRAAQTQRDFAIMAVDIDHFKRINDRHGHPVGDLVLIAVAQALRDNFRAMDLIARIGGEEFLIAMPDTSVAQAQIAAERLCRDIRNAPFVIPGVDAPIRLTLSIGVAMSGSSVDAEPVDHLLNRADIALYAAKSAGRNTVEISQTRAA